MVDVMLSGTNFELVGDFMEAFGQEVRLEPSWPDFSTRELRIDLIEEELDELKTAIAQIDMAAGTAKGDVPISGHGPGGTVKGSGFRILERGKTVVFTGKSKMVLYSTSKPLTLRQRK